MPFDAEAARRAAREAFEAKYETLENVGRGAFGSVHKARLRDSDELVAIKQMSLHPEDLTDGLPAFLIREVTILRNLSHPNIVRFHEFIEVGLDDCYLVFEYVEMDLGALLKCYRKAGDLMPLQDVRLFSKQLLSGCQACHLRSVIHRDLKPQNILVKPGEGVKICDFGLARAFELQPRQYSHDVITLWYRPPEILLGSREYGTEVDMWSAGCVILEMARGFAAFTGDSEIGTLFKIFQLTGTPTEASWSGVTRLKFWSGTFPKWPTSRLEEQALQERPELGDGGIKLLQGLLCQNPQSRMSARQALRQPFLADTH